MNDLSGDALRAAADGAVARMIAYLEGAEALPVLPAVQPGDVRRALPEAAPSEGETFDRILADYDRIIVPNTTHWNHPGFMAYFATTGSAAGILGELLASTLNVNAMLWRTGPAETELEEVALDWLRRMLGLPDGLVGHINDTASSSTLYVLAAARESTGLDVRERGLSGPDVPRLVVYCSEEAHSSVDKACITLGIGLRNVRRIATDAAFRMDVDALRRAMAEDRAAGALPMAVVATVGTTGVTAVDPVPEIADVCAAEGVWLHVDAAYGGMAAAVPEMRSVLDGCDRADSIVVNPHKWMFVPLDCSALYTRRPQLLRQAFSLVPEYLTTTVGDQVTNLMDYGVSLGRRFRALKLWFVLRSFGSEGIAEALRGHLRMAAELAEWVRRDARFELMAPVGFSVVVLRWKGEGEGEREREQINAAILERVNASGEVYLSHTKVRGNYAIRVAIGNLRTERRHVARAWDLIRAAAAEVVSAPGTLTAR